VPACLVTGREFLWGSEIQTIKIPLVTPAFFMERRGLKTPPAKGGGLGARAAGVVTIPANKSIFGFDGGIQTRAGGPPTAAGPPPLTTLRDVPDISLEAGGTLRVSGFNAIVRSERLVQDTSSPVSSGNIAINADRVEGLGGT